MKINTILTPLSVDELFFTKKTTIVIDVLRASTTIVTALDNEAKEIIPVGSIEFAMKVSGSAFGGQTLLAGERNAIKIDGFALGNSPLEFVNDNIKGKSIILYTTNGSKSIVKAKYSSELFIASFLNLKTIAEFISNQYPEVILLCSGNNGIFCLEDSVCAGKLISELILINNNIQLTDGSKASLVLYKKYKNNIHKMLSESEHGINLIEKGFENDIAFAAQENISNLIPFYDTGVIKAKKL